MFEHGIKEDIFNILRLLALKSDLTQRDISDNLGVSLGKTNYLLKSLIAKNLIKMKDFSLASNKAKKVKYILTREGFEEKLKLTFYYLRKKEQEYLDLKNEISKANEPESVKRS